MYTTRSDCRICANDLLPLFSIPAPLVSGFPTPEQFQAGTLRVPLDVMRCTFCEHVQLGATVDPGVLYQEYWYESGINERMCAELATVVSRAQDYLQGPLEPGDHVLDIGANDGTLLKNYAPGILTVAIEPSGSFQAGLRQIAGLTLQGTFPEIAPKIPPTAFKIVTSVAMFYDLDEPVRAAEEIRRLLHPYGVWVCQFQDLEQQVRFGVWDNFVHEHVSYFTLGTFQEAVRQAGLQIIDVEQTSINGGGLRVFIGHQVVWQQRPSVQQQLYQEYRMLDSHWPQNFARRMQRNVAQIRAFVEWVTNQGGIVDLYGASTKGNTLLQVVGITDYVRCAWERNPRKYGRLTVTGVPIIDEELGRSNPPTALLTTIWQFKDQIIAREKETLKTIRLILPLPEATWVECFREAV